MVFLNTWAPGVTGELNFPILSGCRGNLENTRLFKAHSEWNKKTQSQCLKKSWALFGECGRGKKMEMFRLLPTQSTWHCYATSNTAEPCSNGFSGNFCHTTIWVCAIQRTSNARTSSYLWPSQECFHSPPPQKRQTTSKSQFQKCLIKAIFLWINIKNRPQELDLKKK